MTRVARRSLALILVPLSLMALQGCSSTRVTSSWKDALEGGKLVSRIAVFAPLRDGSTRQAIEDGIVAALAPETDAVASHTLFPALDGSAESIRERLRAESFDAALTVRVVSAQTTDVNVPPRPPLTAFATNTIYAYGYDYPGFGTGKTRTDTRVDVEAILIRLLDEKVLWTGHTETVNPKSVAEFEEGVVAAIAEEVLGEDLVTKR